MKILIINKSDATGGAAVVSRRLLDALISQGADARMLVVEKLTDHPHVWKVAPDPVEKIPFLTERLKIFLANGLNRDTLFKIDTSTDGLPLHRHPMVKEADVIILNWINQGMLSISEIEKIVRMGKKIIWTMHDMWNATGVCHHAGDCAGYISECGNCPLLGKKSGDNDLSNRTLVRKRKLYSSADIHFVAVSSWLEEKASQSTLMRNADISVIPNAFPIEEIRAQRSETGAGESRRKQRIIFGAARIDDPIKGFSVFKQALQIFKEKYPQLAEQTEVTLYGSLRNPMIIENMPLVTEYRGVVKGEEELRRLYYQCDVAVSSSVYETLPGTLVEGQAYGCIPVAFDHGGQRDIITHKDTGYLCDWDDSPSGRAEKLADGIAWALGQPEDIRRRMYEHVAETFSYRAVAKAYLNLISRI